MVKEVKASHILVAKRTDAERLIDKINGGSKFEDLARKLFASREPGDRL